MASIQKPRMLSVKTALQLYNLKIAPAAAYAITLVWKHLSTANLETLNRAKEAYLERFLGLHATAKDRMAYLLAGTPSPLEICRNSSTCPARSHTRKTSGDGR